MFQTTTSQVQTNQNYYEVLNSHQTDSIENIKKKYQLLLLQHHPDKKQNNADNHISSNVFHCIDAAWKTLRDPAKRRAYDAEINQEKFNEKPIVHDTLTLDEFDIDNDNCAWTHTCRCGGYFILSFDECPSNTNDDEIFIDCNECSLVIQLIK